MPVSFEPAQPVGGQIAAGYGATEQWNKFFPTYAGLAEAAARNNLALRQQQMAQSFAGSQQTTENLARQGSQETEMDARARMQQENIRSQQEDIGDRMYAEAALSGIRVSQAEQARMQQQEHGVQAILQAKADGVFGEGPEADQAVNEQIMELRSGIDMTKQRLAKDHADDYQAQAQLRRQQAENLAGDNEAMKKFEADRISEGYSTLKFHDPNGKLHVLLKNEQTGDWYNPLTGGGRPQPEKAQDNTKLPYTDKAGEFDATSALKRAKSEAEAEFPVQKEPDDDGRMVDKNAAARAQKQTELFNDFKGNHETATGRDTPQKQLDRALDSLNVPPMVKDIIRKASQAPPPAAPKQVEAIDKTLEKVMNNDKLNDTQKTQAINALRGIRQIQSQYPSLQASPPAVRAQYEALRNVLVGSQINFSG